MLPDPRSPSRRADAARLTSTQNRLWVLQQLAPEEVLFHHALQVESSGLLDLRNLQAALRSLEIQYGDLQQRLDTTGDTVRVVPGAMQASLPVVDLAALAPPDQRREEEHLARLAALRPLPLQSLRPYRAVALRKNLQNHRLLFTVHHLAGDAQTVEGMFRDWLDLSSSSGSPLSDDLEISAELPDLSFWRGALEPPPPAIALPTSGTRPAVQQYRARNRAYPLPDSLVQHLRSFAHSRGLEPWVAALATMEALLSRLSGQHDFAILAHGAPRSTDQILRTDTPRCPSFEALVERLAIRLRNNVEHPSPSFAELVEELNPERDLSRSPLAQVAFDVRPWTRFLGERRGVAFVLTPVETTAVTFDLELTLRLPEDGADGGDGAECHWRADAALFDGAALDRLQEMFLRLLQAYLEAPQRPLEEPSLLSADRRRQLVTEWNDTARKFSGPLLLHRCVEEQARRTPDATAVVFEDQNEDRTLTYGELQGRIEALSRRLRALGIGPERAVGVCLERSPDLVVALPAVMRAGGAYVPLDPDLPQERLAFLLEDSGASVVISRAELEDRLPAEAVVLRVNVEEAEGTDGADGADPDVGPDNLAYIIYTSGSTGRPKGAMNSHRGVINRLRWMQHTFPLTPEDRVLQKTPASFDVSVWEFFWPLISGAQLVLARPGGHRDSTYLVNRIRSGGITQTHFVPSMLELFLEAPGVERCTSLERVFCSGEALRPEQVRRFFQMSSADLHNLYGPTETAIEVTHWQCSPETGETVPIGRPLANLRNHVLDPHLRLQPVGVTGELMNAGVSVGRGYLGRPALTAESFVPDPYPAPGDTLGGRRMYRTGDLARWTPEGNLEYLGRLDFQVKVRGFRIELEEIEHTLDRHPTVAHCVVTASRRGSATQLVAYLVPASGKALDSQALKAFLGESLPEYMIPSLFIPLDAFPLTGSGKVDRRALPEPGPQRPRDTGAYVAPRGELEASLTVLWGSVLGLEQVGIEDDFFDLGGHSLLATQLIARLRRDLGIELAMHSLFAHPTVARLARVIQEAEQNREDHDAPTLLPELVPVSRGERPALSFAQQRLWFLEQLESVGPAYNVAIEVAWAEYPDPRRLEEALRRVEQRHEVLRTTFAADEAGVPYQVIHPESMLRLPRVDLTALDSTEQHREARRLALADAAVPFDLEAGPVTRATLLRLADDASIPTGLLLLNRHHIACDDWSTDILLREVTEACTALRHGRSPNWRELPVQYADYAAWQRQEAVQQHQERELGYWQDRLADLPPLLELPADRPRPPRASYRGDHVTLTLDKELTAGLLGLARRHGATLFMITLATFQGLLARLAGQGDIPVGVPVANRGHSELEGLVGFFLNTLVLRAEVGAAMTFEDLLDQTRERVLEALSYQELPLDRLVEELTPDRSLGHSPLFQVMFAMDTAPLPLHAGGDGSDPVSRHHELSTGTSKFDWTLSLVEDRGRLRGYLEYSSDLFDRTRAQRAVGHLKTLARDAVADPARPLATLPLLSPAERSQVLVQWNDTPDPGLKHRTLVDFFAGTAARLPRGIAVVDGEREVSYRELDEASCRLAHHLRRLGVGPEAPVAVAVERSAQVAVALLGVMRAGGIFLPLDPTYPPARLAQMLKDTGPDVMLATSGALQILEECNTPLPAQVLHLDDPEPAWQELPGEPPLDLLLPENLAYMIYTSGSTGIPKGIAMSHEAIVHLLTWQTGESQVGQGDRTLQFSPLNFDVCFQEFFTTWDTGGALVMVSSDVRLDPRELLTHLVQHRVNRLFLPFVALQSLAVTAAEEGAVQPPLREVITAGEALQRTPSLVRWLETLGDCRLVNQYGPSEAHVITAWTAPREPAAMAPLPPVGRPVSGMEVYALDALQSPAPIGVPGEVVVGGPQVARGYWRRPSRTAQSFVPDPFSGRPGARLYLTGDRCRRRPDGDFEFLGRVDRQVKIRGFRVEPGEIEAVAQKHPRVRDVVVTVREVAGLKALVAYVVSDGQGDSDPETFLRHHLTKHLPEPLVPRWILAVDALPRAATGKVDYRSLPMPEPGRATGAGRTVPRNAAQARLAAIWEEVLDVPDLSVDDDFFHLGGHSLLAAQVMSRLRSTFGVNASLRSLFKAPTVAGLVAELGLTEVVEEDAGDSGGSALRPLTEEERRQPLPLSFAQERLWFLDQLWQGLPTYNLFHASRLRGALEPEALEEAIQRIVERHEVLGTTYAETAGQARQVIDENRSLPLPMIDLSRLDRPAAEREQAHLLRRIDLYPFDLAEGPLSALFLLRRWPEDHVLTFVQHHSITDGASHQIFFHELEAHYRAVRRGTDSADDALPPLPIQYPDFAAWQRRCWPEDQKDSTDLEAWKQQFRDAPPGLDLPADRPRPTEPTLRGHSLPLHLPEALASRLRAVSQEHGATFFMTVLAAFGALLDRYAGQGKVALGTPVSIRDREELEPLLGFFINTMVLLLETADEPSFSTLLERAREQTLAAYDHRHLPFERLVAEVQPERTLNTQPLFQVLCQMEGAPPPRPRLEGVESTLIRPARQVANFDLYLLLFETPDGVEGTLEYSTDLFDATTIQRLLGHFRRLLEGVAAAPEARQVRPATLPMLSLGEHHQLLVENNDTAVPQTFERLHDSFLAQAARTPDVPALSVLGTLGEEEVWSYARLASASKELAARLRDLDPRIGPDVPVGLCLERTPELGVALLGILQAGAGYLPLDPTHPPERLRYVVEDSGTPVILTSAALRERLPETAARVVDLEELLTEAAPPSAALPSCTDPDSLAYTIYTSGSTGRPKGVMVPHRAAANFLASMARRPGLGAGDTLLAVTTLAFDISVLEIFLPWSVGAHSALVPRETAVDGPALATALEASCTGGNTLMQATPATWRLLLEAGWQGHPNLTALCGGEALPPDLAARLVSRCRALWNMYGPTETTVWSALDRVTGPPVLLGRPIDNTRIHLLHRRFQPVPAGVAGEIFLAGTGVTRGYHDRPALTAERFIPDPFGGPGARLYRVGDGGRVRPDGRLEFLGRTDHQIKIRGFRLELGEIEAVLGDHPAVAAVAVALRQVDPGDPRLVAYVTEDGGAPLSVPDLRRHAHTQLPPYAVPTAFVPLEALPLNPSGKVDRRALPDPAEFLEPSRETVRTESPLSQGRLALIAQIWEEILGVTGVGRDDHFFHLGGHSLLATRLLSRLRESFEVEVPLKWVFDHPTLDGMAEAIEAARQVAGKGEAKPPLRPLSEEISTSTPDTGPYPVSFAQRGLWLFERLYPGRPTYNVPYTLELRGPHQILALEASLAAVRRRHQVLRGRFVQRDGEPYLEVPVEAHQPLPVVDLSSLVEGSDIERVASTLTRQESRLPFDLAAGPLMRACLLCLGADRHTLVANFHHSVVDAASLEILSRELEQLYPRFLESRSGAEEEGAAAIPTIQYTDFARRERDWFSGARLERETAVWCRLLEGAPDAVEIPSDRPRPAILSFRGASIETTFPAALKQSVVDLSRQRGVTPFMTFMAAFVGLLHRLNGKTDLVVGTAVANRSDRALEGLMGYFINTLPLRVNLATEEPFAALLDQVRHGTLTLHDNGETPFPEVVEALGRERDPSRHPVFQILLQQIQGHSVAPRLPDLEVRYPYRTTGTAKFDLDITLADEADEAGDLAVMLEYSTDLYDRTTMQRLLGHYRGFLESLLARPACPVEALPFLTPSERHQLLVEWNDSAVELSRTETFLDLFARQVRERPNAAAIVDGERVLSYEYLDAASNLFARQLLAQGVGAETRVCILLPQSASLILAALATLKVGGSYMPLDLAYPDDRLAFMLEDCARSSPQKILVTQKALQHRYRNLRRQGEKILFLEVSKKRKALNNPGPPEIDLHSDELAYTIYTSGSTGRPKGTTISHRSLLNLVNWHTRDYGLRPGDRASLVAAPGFDVSVCETWPYLAAGATLYVSTPEVRKDAGRLVRWLVDQRMDLAFLPTPLGEAVLQEEWPKEAPLRFLFVGGDKLNRRPRPGLPFTLVNFYGPTENTVWSTISPVPPEGDLPPIGRPLDNVQGYVLDDRQRPTALGTPGELILAGDSLARHYAGRPALTAEKFMPNPFAAQPGSRMYRTGDLARYQTDGEVQFMGRLDHQVKLRGFRIELGEIEAVLRRHPAVGEAVVQVRGTGAAQQLVAFCSGRSRKTPSTNEVRTFLSKDLPEYMVPTNLVFLEALPLNTNGKIDRKALAEIELLEESAGGGEPPANETETALVAVWSDILKLRQVGVTDNFFSLGGNSLLAVHVVTHLRRRFGLDLPASTLFQASTVRRLAELVASETGDGSSPLVLLNEKRRARLPFFCIHGMSGSIFRFVPLAQAMNGSRSFYGLQDAAQRNHTAYLTSVEAMAEHYFKVLRGFQRRGPYLLGGYSVGGLVALEMARRLEAAGESVPVVVLLSDPINEGDEPALACALGIAVPPEVMRKVPRHRRLEFTLRRGLEGGQLPAGFTMQDARHFIRIYKDTFVALHLYKPQPVRARLVLFDPEGGSPNRGSKSPLESLVIEIHATPGTHASCLLSPNAEDLGTGLDALLEEVEEGLDGSREEALRSLVDRPPTVVPPSQGSLLAERLYRLRRHAAAWWARRQA